jgi:hypothetical protein
LFPDYATLGAPDRSQLGTSNYTEYLERFVAEVKPQVISYDNYMVQYSQDLKDSAQAASYYRNLLEVRRVAQEHQLPFLNIVSCNQIRPETPIPSPANFQFQAYTTLAAGYRGVTWYNYYGPGYHYMPIDASGRRTLSWLYLRDVNAQIAALARGRLAVAAGQAGRRRRLLDAGHGWRVPARQRAGLCHDRELEPGKVGQVYVQDASALRGHPGGFGDGWLTDPVRDEGRPLARGRPGRAAELATQLSFFCGESARQAR